MALLPGFEYDIFISYRHNDNRSGWVTEFVKHLQEELSATLKDPVSVYFDTNPHDGLLETHNVDKSLEGKLKCLIFIPILSQTYCDPKSFAWQYEFCVFNKMVSTPLSSGEGPEVRPDPFGRDIKLSNGNVSSRILPIKIHDIDAEDKAILKTEIGGMLRAIEFIYKEPGVNRPLKASDSKADNQNKTDYRNQVNKVANAIKEIISGMKAPESPSSQAAKPNADLPIFKSHRIRKSIITAIVLFLVVFLSGYYFYPKLVSSTPEEAIEKSIAVLPFVNLSSDPEQQYFADGLSEEIINALTQIPELKVIASTSSFKIKGDEDDYQSVGMKLGVANILKGTVRRNKGSVRVIAQLISVADGSNRWSKTIDNASGEMIPVQEEIAKLVASHFKTTLYPSMPKTEWNETALKLYQQGRFYYDRGSPADRAIASKFFERAIQNDSTKAIVYAYLASYYSYIDTSAFQATAKRSIDLDSTLGEANIVLASHARSKLDFVSAESFLQKGLRYGGSSPFCLRGAGRILSEWGRFAQAIELCRKAIELDPLKAYHYSQLGITYLFAGKYSEAILTMRKGLSLSPDLVHGHGVAAVALLLSSKIDEAQAENALEKGEEFHDQIETAILHAQGKTTEALAKYTIFAGKYGSQVPNMVAGLASQIQLPDESIYWLTKALETKTGGMEYILVDPFMNNMRGNPRFIEIIERLNFPTKQTESKE